MKPTAILIAATIFAAPSPLAASDETCKLLGAMAEKVMTLRQQDKPMSSVMSDLVQPIDDAAARKMTRDMVIAAYKRPSWRTAENKAQEAAEFRNTIELECYEAVWR